MSKLKLSFEPATIQHLGLKMYSQAPAAVVELISNAYDADATEVNVILSNTKKTIEVVDNGHGMTLEELNSNFLKIGRNRRIDNGGKTRSGKRFVSGKKGLGKLALFGLGEKIKIITTSIGDDLEHTCVMSWQDIKNKTDGEYEPIYSSKKIAKDLSYTVCIIDELKRKTNFKLDAFFSSIAKLVNYVDSDFKLFVQLDDDKREITPKTKYEFIQEIEFDWNLDKLIKLSNNTYFNQNGIKGEIFTAKKPISPELRGITLYANGRLVNAPEFFVASTSSNFFSYCTGSLNVDFIDEGHGEDDLIATNRQSLNWELPIAQELKKNLEILIKYIHQEWRSERKKKNEKEAKEKIQNFEKIKPSKKKALRDFLSKSENDASVSNAAIKLINNITPPSGNSGKKVIISHSSDNKPVADKIYSMLLFYGFEPSEIIYTSSENIESLLPAGVDILEYIRKFFVQDWYDNPEVFFIGSEKLDASWFAMLEVGATWVTQTFHQIAVIDEYMPKKPINPDNNLFVRFEKNNTLSEGNKLALFSVLNELAKRHDLPVKTQLEFNSNF